MTIDEFVSFVEYVKSCYPFDIREDTAALVERHWPKFKPLRASECRAEIETLKKDSLYMTKAERAFPTWEYIAENVSKYHGMGELFWKAIQKSLEEDETGIR